MEDSEKYEEIISLLERFVRPRAIESLDLEGVFQAIDVDGDGNVDTEEYFTGIMMLCENNAVNDRQLLLNLQKMLHCTVQHDMLDEQRWRMQQGTRLGVSVLVAATGPAARTLLLADPGGLGWSI